MIEDDVEHLYTTKDVARVRDKLKQEQSNLDPITGLKIPDKQAVLQIDYRGNDLVQLVCQVFLNQLLGRDCSVLA